MEEPPSTVEGKQTFYRVMAGSFLVKENANKQVENLRKAGFDATILEFHK
ncbi:SPOR domain-containing protein [Natranaerovirga pectinivora]